MRTKHYMLFALIAQLIFAAMNITILVTAVKRYAFYTLFYINIPVLVSTILMIIYYKRYVKKNFKLSRTIIAILSILVNISYTVIIYIDDKSEYFFFATSILIFVNALFVMKYVLLSIKRMVSGNSILILQFLLMLSMGLSSVSMFYSGADKMISINYIVAASILLTICFWRLRGIYKRIT